MGAFVQQSLDDVDVHLVAVSANCTVAVDIPMTVDEVIHIAVIPLAIQNHRRLFNLFLHTKLLIYKFMTTEI